MQGSFGCQWRRSDATIKSGTWERYWNISRASVRWFDGEMREVVPSPDNLWKLHEERAGYASVRSPPGKNDQAGDGATARFPSLLPLASKGSFCPGMSLLELELDNPCWDPGTSVENEASSMCLHVPTCAYMCLHVPTCAYMCLLVLTVSAVAYLCLLL